MIINIHWIIYRLIVLFAVVLWHTVYISHHPWLEKNNSKFIDHLYASLSIFSLIFLQSYLNQLLQYYFLFLIIYLSFYPQKRRLLAHRSGQHMKQEYFKCDVCGKEFNRKYCYKKHMKIHNTGKKLQFDFKIKIKVVVVVVLNAKFKVQIVK